MLTREQINEGIRQEVYVANVYRLPEALQGQVVIDGGAHWGWFSRLALERSATVLAYEPDAMAFEQLSQLPDPEGRLSARKMALWRSDQEPCELSMTDAPSGVNSMAVHDIPDQIVPTWGLDDVLREVGVCRFLKLDVEGAEFPILFTSSELARVQEIALEYHLPPEYALRPEGQTGNPQTAEALKELLEQQGFGVETVKHPHSEVLGFMYGTRPGGGL